MTAPAPGARVKLIVAVDFPTKEKGDSYVYVKNSGFTARFSQRGISFWRELTQATSLSDAGTFTISALHNSLSDVFDVFEIIGHVHLSTCRTVWIRILKDL